MAHANSFHIGFSIQIPKISANQIRSIFSCDFIHNFWYELINFIILYDVHVETEYVSHECSI